MGGKQWGVTWTLERGETGETGRGKGDPSSHPVTRVAPPRLWRGGRLRVKGSELDALTLKRWRGSEGRGVSLSWWLGNLGPNCGFGKVTTVRRALNGGQVAPPV